MTHRLSFAALAVAGCVLAGAGAAAQGSLATDLDAIFANPVLARAVMAVRVESLTSGQIVYERHADTLVMPASNMKLVTIAVAAERLGWNYRYETRLESAGSIKDGMLTGDLIVTGSGDPSIGSADTGHAALFLEWADALSRAGITRVNGRLIGDDNAFDDDGLGAGWAWDYLSAGYAAPTGALSYNENAAVALITAGATVGAPATIVIGPPGHGLDVVADVVTRDAAATATIDLRRPLLQRALMISGHVPLNGPVVARTAAVDNPTRYFVDALALALASRGITVSHGAWDIDELTAPARVDNRRLIASHQSEPLSTLAGYAMKVSQNFYGETFLKTLGRVDGRPGTAAAGLQRVRETLASWGIAADSTIIVDGSGLSRYNYLTATAIVGVLKHVWSSEALRGPFVAELPVGGRDGSLELRMRSTVLDRNVQAKTGTISNARALSGYLQTAAGEKLVFSMIANNYTAPSAQIDAVVERALVRLVN